jgi:N-acetylmuramoyl-L-alanine amidase
VKLTREDSSTPTLTQRAQTANAYGADLFVSLHSNAVSGGWNDAVRGLTVWTYAAGGERNRAARRLLDEMKLAGVKTFGAELYHNNFTVLANTTMPAYLIEYAFHTAREDVALLLDNSHRDKLAEATAKAICAWGGIGWIAPPKADNKIYRVQMGAFTVEENAKNQAKELEAKGYKPFIVTEEKS